MTGDVELEEEDIIIEEAWWFHPSVEPRVITREEFHVRSARSLRSEFYQVPVDLRLDGSFEPPGGSMDVRFSLLDILLHKVGYYVRDVPTFLTWVFTCRQVRLQGVGVISALTYFREPNASEENGEEVDIWAVSLWSPSLNGIGNLVAAAESGYGPEIRALVSPSGVPFVQATIMKTPEFWMSEGLVLELCVKHVRLLGATTRPFFEGVASRLSSLQAVCARKMSGGIVREYQADDDDQMLCELVRRTTLFSRRDEYVVDWSSLRWRRALYNAALRQLGITIAAWREWHASEAVYMRFLSKTLARRCSAAVGDNVVIFLYGSCRCAICRRIG